MNDRDHDLRERLVRLEHGMPAGLPRDLGGTVRGDQHQSEARSMRLRLAGMLAAAVLAGATVGGIGVSFLASGQPTTPILPSGLYRSASPVSGPICAMVEFPIRDVADRLAQTRVWWWHQGPEGCGQRSDFIYVQWVQPVRAPAGVTVSLTVELRDESRHALSFTFDPLAEAAVDGTLATFRDPWARLPGIRLVPTEGFNDIEEALTP